MAGVELTDFGILMVGALGALITVYISKKTVVPEFRPFFDVAVYQAEVVKTRGELEDLDARRKRIANGEPVDLTRESALNARHDDLSRRVSELESRLLWNQVISRTLGTIVYIVAGGGVAWLVVRFAPLDADLASVPTAIAAFVVGSGWTTYLSVLGHRALPEAMENRIDSIHDHYEALIERTKREVVVAAMQALQPTQVVDGGRALVQAQGGSSVIAVVEQKFGDVQAKAEQRRRHSHNALANDLRGF